MCCPGATRECAVTAPGAASASPWRNASSAPSSRALSSRSRASSFTVSARSMREVVNMVNAASVTSTNNTTCTARTMHSGLARREPLEPRPSEPAPPAGPAQPLTRAAGSSHRAAFARQLGGALAGAGPGAKCVAPLRQTASREAARAASL
ncbi:hypothetical protein T492DRAFT_844623 [Pavlovales sp. CCMP2436]|nr:hypothetical protein T492DRAFT_844623 [Pavlovales sp. CCMP2436]